MKILIVEDNKKLASFLLRALAEEGYVVDLVEDGGIAITQSRSISYDLVILDCSLPAARGEEPFDAIRRLSPGARVLLLSGYSEERAAAPLAGRGLAGFLQKPFLPERLLERVRAALGR